MNKQIPPNEILEPKKLDQYSKNLQIVFNKISANFSYDDLKKDKYFEDKKLWRNRPRLEMILMTSGGID